MNLLSLERLVMFRPVAATCAIVGGFPSFAGPGTGPGPDAGADADPAGAAASRRAGKGMITARFFAAVCCLAAALNFSGRAMAAESDGYAAEWENLSSDDLWHWIGYGAQFCSSARYNRGQLKARCTTKDIVDGEFSIVVGNCPVQLAELLIEQNTLVCVEKLLTYEQIQRIPGNWYRHCDAAWLNGSHLVARCAKDEYPKMKTSAVNLDSCRTSIQNVNGQLVCAAGDTAPELQDFMSREEMQQIPGGWWRSCRNAYDNGKELVAECTDPSGNWVATAVRTNPCDTTFENRNGQLICATPEDIDALAQASQNRSLTPEQMQQIPGDWSDSCRNALVNGNSLVAECTDQNGNWVSSAVDAQSCMTAIDNQDGRMICAAPGEADALAQGTRGRRMTPQQMRQIPGEWWDSCRNAFVNGKNLVAECTDMNGNWVSSAVDAESCETAIANQNGRLACVISELYPDTPTLTPQQMREIPGPWSDSCTDAQLSGTILVADCTDSEGTTSRSGIDLNSCNTTIEYMHGYLVCAAPAVPAAPAIPAAPAATVAPAVPAHSPQGQSLTPEQMREIPGPWFDSCQNAVLEGTNLVADCRDPDGAWVKSGLDLEACERDSLVVNDGGRLVCQ